MEVRFGQTATVDFTTHNPLTGQVSDAVLLPTVQIFEDDNDTPIATPTVVKRLAQTGNYRVTFTVSNPLYHSGSSYNIIATVTIAGVTAKARIEDFQLVTNSSITMSV